MGDRANVKILASENPPVYLYTHWGGQGLPVAVQNALKHRARWDDDCYLARIVFDAMKGDNPHPHTGFGIAAYVADNDPGNAIIELDTRLKRVRWVAWDWRAGREAGVLREWSFEEYILEDPQRLTTLYGDPR